MRKSNIFIFTLLLVVAASSLSTFAAEKPQTMKFYYEYRPGATYRISIEMDNRMTMEAPGEGAEEVAAMAAMMGNMQQLANMGMEQKFGPADQAGDLPFEARISDYRMKTFMGGAEMQMPPEMESAMKDLMMKMKWTGKMTRRGKVVDLHVTGMENIPGTSAKEIDEIFTSVPEFPEKEMTVGDDFTHSFTRTLDMGPMEQGSKAEMITQYHYHLKEIREGAAHFDIKVDYQIAGTSEKEGNFTIKGSGNGYGLFDLERHFFIKMHFDNDYAITTDLSPKGKAGEERKKTEPSQMIIKMKQVMTMASTISE